MTISLAIASLVMMGEAQGSQVTFDNQPQITQVSYEKGGEEQVLNLYGNNEVIVETQNLEQLNNFVSQYGLEIRPLMDPEVQTQEAQDAFLQYKIIKIPSSLQSSEKQDLVSLLTDLSGTVEIKPNKAPYYLYPDFDQTNQTFNFPDTSLDNPYTPNDPLFPQQWDKTKMQCEYVWGADINGENIIIAYIDSGVDTDHEDLIDNIIPGWNFLKNSSNVEDGHGHGTHVSGIGSAKGDNNKGIAGVSYNASIMPLKVMNNQGNFEDWVSIINSITYAADNGANIINMSWGRYGDPYSAEKNALNYAYEKGLVLFAAVGNENRDAPNDYPSAYEVVIGVGGSNKSDGRWIRNSSVGSNYGLSVDFFAPGEAILATALGGRYEKKEGTSGSTAEASGVGALMLEANPSLTPERVRELLSESADTITTDKGKVLRVNAKRAVEKALDEPQGIGEQPPTQRPPELTDILLGNSNLYHQNFSERGTLTIYEASTGRRVQASIQVYGHVDVDFSGFPAGVYFGVYEPQEGRHQVGKIIKTQ